VGSRSKTDLAYIAGFLDGDGSLMLQLKKRGDSQRGIRFMATICLYQDIRHDEDLYWIRDVLEAGYVSRRNDGISELRINGYSKVSEILLLLKQYIRFKKVQTKALLRACKVLSSERGINKLSNKQLKELVDLVLVIQNENYKAHRKKTKKELCRLLGLTP
jgi:hypothetical protein